MRVDTHVHVMLRPFYGRPATDAQRLLDDLANCGLEGCWVSSIDGMTTRELELQRRLHDDLAELVRRYQGRIEAFATVDPGGLEEAAREVRRCVTQLGFLGVKLHPWLQAFSLTHPGMELVMQTAGELGAPVLFHDGTPPYSTSSQLAWLAERFPDTTVIFGHCGLADQWRDAATAGQALANVWLAPTGSPPRTIRAAWDAAGPERFLFGSDAGFGNPGTIRYSLAKFRAVLDEEALERVLSENPVRLMNGCGRHAARRPQ